MKAIRTYRGNPRTLAVLVFLGESGRDGTRPLNPRLELINKAPTGYGWGYAGSGPAQLAFALIADALLADGTSSKPADERLRIAADPRLYQVFKERVVATWDRDKEFEITDDKVREHVAAIIGGTAEPIGA